MAISAGDLLNLNAHCRNAELSDWSVDGMNVSRLPTVSSEKIMAGVSLFAVSWVSLYIHNNILY